VVSAYLAQGGQPNLSDETGTPLLVLAAMYGKGEIVKLLLAAGADPNIVASYAKRSPLIVAADGGHVDIVHDLLAAHADVNYCSPYFQTPLMAAAGIPTIQSRRIVRLLLHSGANVNAGRFTTPLIVASGRGHVESMGLLIRAGAEVNTVRRMGTPLIRAVEHNRIPNAQLLLLHGADLQIRAPEDYSSCEAHVGKTAMEIAELNGYANLQLILKAAEDNRHLGITPRDDFQVAPSVTETWDRIYSLLGKVSLELAGLLSGPATIAQLEELQQEVGIGLPDDFRDCYLIHNGQSLESAFLIPPVQCDGHPYRLLSCGEVLATWKMWHELDLVGQFVDCRPGCDPGLRDAWWLPGWVPFASNGMGDLLCVDLTPASHGRVGQVFILNHEGPGRYLLASSFSLWLHHLANALSQGFLPRKRVEWK
jgi:ankyrin repeat protein